jgi:purine-binding chemotaxis protein CheW
VSEPTGWEALVIRSTGLPLATEEIYQRGKEEHLQPSVARRFLTFMLAREEYALDILRIREIIKVPPITEVPRAPGFVPGIISVRGTIVPVLDLRKRLRHTPAPLGPAARVLIVAREEEPYGLIVDRVVHVVRLHQEDIEPPPAVIGGSEPEFVSGIGRPTAILMPGQASSGRMLIVLNLEAVLAFEVGGLPLRRSPGET